MNGQCGRERSKKKRTNRIMLATELKEKEVSSGHVVRMYTFRMVL